MMDKRNRILVAVLVVQLFILLLVYSGGGSDKAPRAALLSNVKADQVEKITITDDQDNMVLLHRDDLGWFLAEARFATEPQGEKRNLQSSEAVRYPVDQAKIGTLLSKLAGLQSDRLVTRTASSHQRLQVGDDHFSRRIVIDSGAGGDQVLYLGVAPNYKTIHVRIKGDDDVYLVSGLALWEAPAEGVTWWPANYVEVAADELERVTLRNQHGALELVKQEGGAWRMAGLDKPLKNEVVDEFIDRVHEISLVDYLAPEPVAKLGKPGAHLSLHSAHGDVELSIWTEKAGQGGDYAVKDAKASLHALVGAYEVEHLLNRKAADFQAVE